MRRASIALALALCLPLVGLSACSKGGQVADAGPDATTADAPGTDAHAGDGNVPDVAVTDGTVSDGAPSDATGALMDSGAELDADEGDAGCSPLSSTAAARAALAGGKTAVFVDCAQTLQYSRTMAAGGVVATETLTDTTTGAKAQWDFTQAVKTYRSYPTASAMVAAHSVDVYPATADGGVDDSGTDDGGIIQVVATDDTDGDGVPDERSTYLIDPSAATIPLTVETDPSGTGSWTLVLSASEPMEQPTLTIDTDAGDPNHCTAAQVAQVTSSFEQALAQGLPCLGSIGASDLAAHFYEFLMGGDGNLTVTCNPAPPGSPNANECATSNLGGIVTHWFPSPTNQNQYHLTVFPMGFNTTSCGTLASVMFHEMSHFFLGPHHIPAGDDGGYNPFNDPNDRVYACQKTCFGSATGPNAPLGAPNSITCAECAGVSNGDPECASYPAVACPGQTWCWCPSVMNYGSELTCAEDCPSGLACFTAQCHASANPGACP